MLEALPAFLAGLLIGSFLNVCIYRLPRDMSVVRPRSFCPACRATVAWYDNIPLVSYALLAGRCRRCRAPIPVRYPVVELLTALSFAAAAASFGISWPAFKMCLFSALMIGLVFADLEQRILPDEMTLGGLAAGLLISLKVPLDMGPAHLLLPGLDPRWLSLAESAAAAVATAGSLWLVGELYLRLRGREGLGFGDVKMVGMIGAFLGLQATLLALFLGSLLGSVLGVAYIVAAGKRASEYQLPYGTFVGIAATAVAWFVARP